MIKLKILFCQTQFKLGGQQKVLLTIAKELSKKYDVTVYYENHNFYDLEGIQTIQPSKRVQIFNLVIASIQLILKKKKRKKVFADLWHLLNIKSKLKNEEYNLIVLLNPYILFVEEIKKIIKHEKIVCWTHNIYENYLESCFKYEQAKLVKSMALADQVVCLEEYTASRWSEINHKTIVINNPVTIDTCGSVTDLKSKKIGFVGRIQMDSKGIDYLCEVVKKLPDDLVVHVVGAGRAHDENAFTDMIKQCQLEHRINWLGPLGEKDLVQFYKQLTIFLITSRYEGFPLVVVEAMSCGVPVVGFDIPALKEVTKNGKFGQLVPLGDVENLAKLIIELLFNKSKLEKYQKLSLKRAKMLNLESIVTKWEKEVIS